MEYRTDPGSASGVGGGGAGGVVHDLVLAGLGSLQLSRDLAVEHDIHTVGNAQQLRVFAGGVDDAVTLLGDLVDQVEDLLLGAHVDALGGLVEDVNVGIGIQPLV